MDRTVLTAQTQESMKDVYLVLELMETDLQKVLKSLRKTGVHLYTCVYSLFIMIFSFVKIAPLSLSFPLSLFFLSLTRLCRSFFSFHVAQEKSSHQVIRVSSLTKCCWPWSTSTLPTSCTAISSLGISFVVVVVVVLLLLLLLLFSFLFLYLTCFGH